MLRSSFTAVLMGLATICTAQVTPSVGDTFALWFCNATSLQYRQKYDYSAAPGPLQQRLVVHGTESSGSPLVFDIAGPSNNTGAALHVWGAYKGAYPSQTWTLQPVPGQSDTFQIISAYNGKCIGIPPGQAGLPAAYAGASMGMYPCTATDTTQQWMFTPGTAGSVLANGADPTLCAQAGANVPSCDLAPFNGYPYCDPALPTAARVADLLSRMTLHEKVLSMDSSVPAIPRLGVPTMQSGEGLHGPATGCLYQGVPEGSTGCPTSFPCPTALGATFDHQLWTDVGTAIGVEARALYNAGMGSVWLFTPNLNPSRDPRWGRAQEVPGEQAFHVSEYGRAYINGLQGGPGSSVCNGTGPCARLAASTVKHFIAYDLEGYIPRTDVLPRPPTAMCDTPGGCQRWNFDASPIVSDLTDYYFTPFEAAFDVNVSSILCSYNAIYGKPACGSNLLQQLVRQGKGWQGHVVSDYTAIELMGDFTWGNCQPPFPPVSCNPDPFSSHNYTHSVGETTLTALNAGVDNCLGSMYIQWLEYLVQNGTVPESLVETSVARMYTTAIELGLLDPTPGQAYPFLNATAVDSPQHRALALQAAQEGIVLLKNDGRLLPVSPTVKMAFIGPHANSTQAFLSSYHGSNTLVDSHSPLMVAQARGLSVQYAPGCNICDVVPPGFPNMPCPPGQAVNNSGFAAAISAAQAADVAVLFIGSDQTTEAENFDRSNITLVGVQEDLVRAILAVQPRLIVITISGGSISSPYIAQNAPAHLHSFYPGELGGDALIDVLTGVVSPAGAMPVTTYYPNITSQRDIRDMDLQSGQGITTGYFTGPVIYPFGAGMTYSTFSYRWAGTDITSLPTATVEGQEVAMLTMSARDLSAATSPAALSLQVTNEGSMASDIVILGFVERVEWAANEGERGPFRSLFNFTRLRGVQPGEGRMLAFPLPTARPGSALATFREPPTAAPSGSDSEAVALHAMRYGSHVVRLGEYVLTVGDMYTPATLLLRITE